MSLQLSQATVNITDPSYTTEKCEEILQHQKCQICYTPHLFLDNSTYFHVWIYEMAPKKFEHDLTKIEEHGFDKMYRIADFYGILMQ